MGNFKNFLFELCIQHVAKKKTPPKGITLKSYTAHNFLFRNIYIDNLQIELIEKVLLAVFAENETTQYSLCLF